MFFWIALTVIGIAFLSVFSALVFPRLFFKVYVSFLSSKDRGLAKFNLSDGVAILYEPDASVRKYISRYQLYQLNEESGKFFVGEFAQKLSSVQYSVVAYNRRDRVLRAYRVREKNCTQYTKTLTLPEETDYISLVIHSVSGKRIPRAFSFRWTGYLWLALSGISFGAVFDAIFWLVIRIVSHFEGRGVVEILPLRNWAVLLPISTLGLAACCMAAVGLVSLIYFLRDREVLKKFVQKARLLC